MKKNLAFFDTAELYGLGRSEELCGQFRDEFCKSKAEQDKVIIATKFAALPWRTKSDTVVKACKASVKRLGYVIFICVISFLYFHFSSICLSQSYRM